MHLYPWIVTDQDRIHWDDRHGRLGAAPVGAAGPPEVFAPYQDAFPTRGRALDLACGRGSGAVWLASRGLEVWGLDVSTVAVDRARDLARQSGVVDRCTFDVVDLDDGLPPGPPVDVILCHLFRDSRLDAAIVGRLAPGGLLAMAVLSEVDVGPGPFRATAGELRAAFADLAVMAEGEQNGRAWLLATA